MQLTTSLHKIDIDKKVLEDLVYSELYRHFINAIRAWYEAAWSKVPVDTGMAKASLIPLGEHIGEVSTTIYPEHSSKKIDKSVREHYDTDYKTIDAGIDAGETAYKITNKGRLLTFRWDIGVWHWEMNEHAHVLSNVVGNWEAQVAGEEAYRHYFKTHRAEIKRDLSILLGKSVGFRTTTSHLTSGGGDYI